MLGSFSKSFSEKDSFPDRGIWILKLGLQIWILVLLFSLVSFCLDFLLLLFRFLFKLKVTDHFAFFIYLHDEEMADARTGLCCYNSLGICRGCYQLQPAVICPWAPGKTWFCWSPTNASDPLAQGDAPLWWNAGAIHNSWASLTYQNSLMLVNVSLPGTSIL